MLETESRIKQLLLKEIEGFSESPRDAFKKIAEREKEKKLKQIRNIERIRKLFEGDIKIEKIAPVLILCENRFWKDVFKYATTYWSIPVTNGYGRRIKYMVFDKGNNSE